MQSHFPPYISNILGRNVFHEMVLKNIIPSNEAIIFIAEPDMPKEDINYYQKILSKYFDNHILSLFWDLEKDFGNYKIISDNEAKRILDFILKHKKFVVTCAVGHSRSAGVAKAISVIKEFDGDILKAMTDKNSNAYKIENSQEFSPNKTVVNKILNIYNQKMHS